MAMTRLKKLVEAMVPMVERTRLERTARTDQQRSYG